MIVDYCNVMEGREVHRWFCGACGVTICAGGKYTIPAAAAGEGGEAEGEKQAEGGESASDREEEGRKKDAIDSQKEEEITSSTQLELATEDVAGHTEPASFGAQATTDTPNENTEAPKEGAEQPKEGEVVEFFSVNLVTLDQPQEGLDLSVFRIEYWDGRNDNWMAGKSDVPWPGGIV